MLRSLTQFEARVHEQALISYLNPSLKGSKFVSYGFIHWTSDYKPLTTGSMPLKVSNADKGQITTLDIKNNTGLITDFGSIDNTAIGLGLSKNNGK